MQVTNKGEFWRSWLSSIRDDAGTEEKTNVTGFTFMPSVKSGLMRPAGTGRHNLTKAAQLDDRCFLRSGWERNDEVPFSGLEAEALLQEVNNWISEGFSFNEIIFLSGFKQRLDLKQVGKKCWFFFYPGFATGFDLAPLDFFFFFSRLGKKHVTAYWERHHLEFYKVKKGILWWKHSFHEWPKWRIDRNGSREIFH